MPVIKTFNASDIFVVIYIIVEFFSFGPISNFGQQKIAPTVVMLLANIAFVKGLLYLAIGVHVPKTIAPKADIFLRARFCFVGWWKAVHAGWYLWANCSIMANFVTFEANYVVFKIPKIVLIFEICYLIFYLIDFFYWALLETLNIVLSFLSNFVIWLLHLLELRYKIGVFRFMFEFAPWDVILE